MRGEATKIKALLKVFIDACPICQKVRGLHEKVKAKHSFIVSRPFLEVSYDFIVFSRPDKNGNRYMMEVTSVQWKGLASPPVEWCYRKAKRGG